MKPKNLRILIAGVALLIFGPVTGWILTIAGLFHAATTVQPVQPGIMPDFQRTTSQMLYSLIPILVGVFFGAVGFFLTLYALITHFLGPKSGN